MEWDWLEIVIVECEPYSKMDRIHCLQIWIMVDGLDPHLRLTNSFNPILDGAGGKFPFSQLVFLTQLKNC